MFQSPATAPHALVAAWQGCRVPQASLLPLTGRVHSVFARACNISLHGGELLALLHPELPRTPWGLRLSGLRTLARPFDTFLEPGMAVTVAFDSLGIPEAGLSVALDNAQVWQAALPPAPPLTSDDARSALTVLMPILPLPSAQPGELLARRVASRLEAGGQRLGAALAACDTATTLAAAHDLLGLGPGLTPSGDDMLAGVLAALAVTTSADSPSQALYHDLAAFVRAHASAATHAVSAVFLTHAAEGLFAENLRDVLMALRAPQAQALPQAAAYLLRFGASSGADTLAGLCLGLRALANR